jgi:GNAT superfamily N-acetyltransferase
MTLRLRRKRHYSPLARAAMSARNRSLWATGRFATRRKPCRPDRWTAAHERRLRELVGEHSAAEIAAALSAEFPGTPRTATAVLVHAKRLGLRPGQATYNARQVAYFFGIDGKTVTHSWVARGWLPGTRTAGYASQWCFPPAAVEAFIRAYPAAYDVARMPASRWRSLAEAVLRRDPLLTIEEASQAYGIKAATLRTHLAQGWLPGARRFEPGGARAGRWLVPRSALLHFRYRRPELVGVSGRRSGGPRRRVSA